MADSRTRGSRLSAGSTTAVESTPKQLMANLDVTLRQNLSDPFVQEALQSGLDLRVYSESVEKELSSLDALCVADYAAECKEIAELHNRIGACDNILFTLEDLLSTFQNRLSDISTEIKSVQEQSVRMQHCLQNRQLAKVKLSQFVDDLYVPETLIERIMNAAVTDRAFIENLHELHHKLLFAKQQTFREARACADVADTLEKLRIEAIKKVREFILQKIYACRKPLNNYQIHQDAMLRHRFFYEYLLHHDRSVAKSIKDEYAETFSKLYTAYFKLYHKSLYKMVAGASSLSPLSGIVGGGSHTVSLATKDDLLGLVDDSHHSRRTPPNLFSLGPRAVVLEELDMSPVVPHALQDKSAPSGERSSTSSQAGSSSANRELSSEQAFRSLQCAIGDAAMNEFEFISQFFLGQPSACQALFNTIFGQTLQYTRQKTEQSVQENWDLLALLTYAAVIQHYRQKHAKAVVSMTPSDESTKGVGLPSALADYWEALQTTILSRAEFVLNKHINSIASSPHIAGASTAASASKDKSQDAFGGDLAWRPHANPLMRRAVELAVAVARLIRLLGSSPWSDRLEEMSLNLLTSTMNAVTGNFVSSRNKDKLVFVINNCSLAADVSTEQLGEQASLSVAARERLSQAVGLYCEVMITGLLPKLAGAVRDAEYATSSESGAGRSNQAVLEAAVTSAVMEFNAGWKRSLEHLQRETLAAFPDWRAGGRVFQAAAAQLVDLYQRLVRCLSAPSLSRLPVRHDAVSIHTVAVELKRYKTAF